MIKYIFLLIITIALTVGYMWVFSKHRVAQSVSFLYTRQRGVYDEQPRIYTRDLQSVHALFRHCYRAIRIVVYSHNL